MIIAKSWCLSYKLFLFSTDDKHTSGPSCKYLKKKKSQNSQLPANCVTVLCIPFLIQFWLCILRRFQCSLKGLLEFLAAECSPALLLAKSLYSASFQWASWNLCSRLGTRPCWKRKGSHSWVAKQWQTACSGTQVHRLSAQWLEEKFSPSIPLFSLHLIVLLFKLRFSVLTLTCHDVSLQWAGVDLHFWADLLSCELRWTTDGGWH